MWTGQVKSSVELCNTCRVMESFDSVHDDVHCSVRVQAQQSVGPAMLENAAHEVLDVETGGRFGEPDRTIGRGCGVGTEPQRDLVDVLDKSLAVGGSRRRRPRRPPGRVELDAGSPEVESPLSQEAFESAPAPGGHAECASSPGPAAASGPARLRRCCATFVGENVCVFYSVGVHGTAHGLDHLTGPTRAQLVNRTCERVMVRCTNNQ